MGLRARTGLEIRGAAQVSSAPRMRKNWRGCHVVVGRDDWLKPVPQYLIIGGNGREGDRSHDFE